MVFANLTYLDSLNTYIVVCPYKALMTLLWRTGFHWAVCYIYFKSSYLYTRR